MEGGSDYKALGEAYASERPLYEELAAHVAQIARDAVKRAGIYCRADSRAKDVASFLKKIVRKKYGSPEEVLDRAGARVIVAFADGISVADDVIQRQFEVRWREDKGEGLAPDRLGYLGIHYGVALRPDDDEAARFGDRICELQLHTAAQRTWADVSHELLYKPDVAPGGSLARVLYRLMALMEIFDQSVIGARESLRVMPDWKEASILGELERLFLSLTGRDFDRELSLLVLRTLVPTYGEEGAPQIEDKVRTFAAGNQDRLEAIFRDYAEDLRHPLLFQPEAILVFERLEADPFTLKREWQRALPLELLEGLGEVWGVPV